MDWILNTQSTYELFYRIDTLYHSSNEFDDKNLEKSSADLNEEGLVENPTGLIGDISYDYDFPSYDLFDDDCFQREAKLAGPSLVDSWEEDQGQQLQRGNEPSQPIYDTDEESYESLVIDEDSWNFHSVTP